MLNPMLDLLQELIVRNDVLEGQVLALEQALRLDSTANVQSAFDISETLAQVLILLSDGKAHNKENIHGALYYRKPDVDHPDFKITDTILCKLRKHVAPHGIEIGTIWGAGYRITAGLDVVHAAMEGDIDDLRAREAARQRKRERDRLWRRRLRAAQGCKDRQAYLQTSLSRLKPWQEIGVSRATWYRKKREKWPSTAANDDAPVSRRIAKAA